MISVRSGSSPLTRGKQPTGYPHAYRGGLIPAHAGKTREAVACRRVLAAHPRSRGENASRDAHNSEPTGSSPLTRGKRQVRRDERGGIGLIPAHAGKTEGVGVSA